MRSTCNFPDDMIGGVSVAALVRVAKPERATLMPNVGLGSLAALAMGLYIVLEFLQRS